MSGKDKLHPLFIAFLVLMGLMLVIGLILLCWGIAHPRTETALPLWLNLARWTMHG